MSASAPSKVLLVEGRDEVSSLPYLLESVGIAWPDDAPPVHLVSGGGVDQVLDAKKIGVRLKSSGLERLGLLVDADLSAEARWGQARDCLRSLHLKVPDALPPDGAIFEGPRGVRIGIWIMPDNVAAGMYEDWLHVLRESEPDLEAHIETSLEEARTLGASWRDVHRSKARLHTWLAWRDPPGVGLVLAAKDGAFSGVSVDDAFVRWFRALFG